MGYLLALLAGFAPRLALMFYWVANPAHVNAAFSTWLWPILGVIVLPFTTLMYALLYTPGKGVAGWDWLWIGLAFVLDLGILGGSAYLNRHNVLADTHA